MTGTNPTITEDQLYKLKYPLGKFEFGGKYSMLDVNDAIQFLSMFPGKLRDLVSSFDLESLSKSYRPGGWSAAQIVHHLADSHMNGYMRIKLALTEENPTIKPYHESLWAQTPDADLLKVETSLQLLSVVHAKIVEIFSGLDPSSTMKTYFHPGLQINISLREAVMLYAHHARHHSEHLKLARLNRY